MSKSRWTIRLPMYHPPSLNDYATNKGVRMRAVKQLVKVLEPWWHTLSDTRIPSAEARRIVLITIVYGPGERSMDNDNVQKVIKDALVGCKLLRNDSAEWCECPEPEAERGLFAETRIELIEAPPEGQTEVETASGGKLHVFESGGKVCFGPTPGEITWELHPAWCAVLVSLVNRAKRKANKGES